MDKHLQGLVDAPALERLEDNLIKTGLGTGIPGLVRRAIGSGAMGLYMGGRGLQRSEGGAHEAVLSGGGDRRQ